MLAGPAGWSFGGVDRSERTFARQVRSLLCNSSMSTYLRCYHMVRSRDYPYVTKCAHAGRECGSLSEMSMNKREFLRALEDLERKFSSATANPGSYRCEKCSNCFECMFCRDCSTCSKCTYCTGCQACSGCTHCEGCEDCHNCSYSVQSSHCTGSRYLILSRRCAGCTFCFGCVGLVGKEFHILNEAYPRKEYFERVAKLKKEFGIRAREMRWPWLGAGRYQLCLLKFGNIRDVMLSEEITAMGVSGRR